MKIISNKAWYIIIAVTAVLTAVAFVLDDTIAKTIFFKNNFFGSFCENIATVLPFAMCSFFSATLMTCRNTHATRTKNKILNVSYGILSVAFAFLASYYPFRNEKSINYIIVAGITLIITALSVYINFTQFSSTHQKIVMSDTAGITLISLLVIVFLCALTFLFPERMNYATLQRMLSSFYDPEEIDVKVSLPIAIFSGASTAFAMIFNALPSAVPKLKFSRKIIFALTIIWTFGICVGLVSTGKVYASQACVGTLMTLVVIFMVSNIVAKREKRI